ncbi:solute carrier family 35 member F6 [Pelomyxa schiedti]|nr:solute carrier family 35 member F6 [Pelomyxa schiedti]
MQLKITPLQLYHIVLVCGMLLTGCINTLSKKFQNDTESPGYNGDVHYFAHPWFQTLVMFTGEFLCLIGIVIQRHQQRVKQLTETPLVHFKHKDRIFQLILIIPTLLDLLGTSLGGIGLVYVSASVWQMLRGSIIIFTGILSKFFLKRKLLPYRWFAMCVTIVGLVLVGVSGLLSENLSNKASTSGSTSSSEDSSDSYMMIFGMICILLGQLVGAIQMVIEEKFLKSRGLQPFHVVGMEGFFGVLLMAFTVLPFFYVVPGKQDCSLRYQDKENSIDAILQILHNWQLVLYVLLYLCSIAFYNFFGLSVTKSLTCVHRTLIDACRTIIVWTVDLFIWYVIDAPQYGEEWTIYSWVQVAGFLLLIGGTILYNGIIHIPGFEYEAPAAPPTAPPATSPTVEAGGEKTPLLSINSAQDPPKCTSGTRIVDITRYLTINLKINAPPGRLVSGGAILIAQINKPKNKPKKKATCHSRHPKLGYIMTETTPIQEAGQKRPRGSTQGSEEDPDSDTNDEVAEDDDDDDYEESNTTGVRNQHPPQHRNPVKTRSGPPSPTRIGAAPPPPPNQQPQVPEGGATEPVSQRRRLSELAQPQIPISTHGPTEEQQMQLAQLQQQLQQQVSMQLLPSGVQIPQLLRQLIGDDPTRGDVKYGPEELRQLEAYTKSMVSAPQMQQPLATAPPSTISPMSKTQSASQLTPVVAQPPVPQQVQTQPCSTSQRPPSPAVTPSSQPIGIAIHDETHLMQENPPPSPQRPQKKLGRRKINIEFIEDKSRRHITFSKRKAGIMKKAYELSTLTGTQVLLLVASETGHVYTFATPKLQPLITKPEGKQMIQGCLNSAVDAPGSPGGRESPPTTPTPPPASKCTSVPRTSSAASGTPSPESVPKQEHHHRQAPMPQTQPQPSPQQQQLQQLQQLQQQQLAQQLEAQVAQTGLSLDKLLPLAMADMNYNQRYVNTLLENQYLWSSGNQLSQNLMMLLNSNPGNTQPQATQPASTAHTQQLLSGLMQNPPLAGSNISASLEGLAERWPGLANYTRNGGAGIGGVNTQPPASPNL